MPDSILSNSSYILHYSKEQLEDHRELFLVGSTLSEWLDYAVTPEKGLLATDSLLPVPSECLYWVAEGQHLSWRWNRLAWRLGPAYHDARCIQ